MPSPEQRISRISACFDEATNLFFVILNDADPVVVGYGRSIARNGGGVAVVIDDASLLGSPLCEFHKV